MAQLFFLTTQQFVRANTGILERYPVEVQHEELGRFYDDIARFGHVAGPRRSGVVKQVFDRLSC